MKQLFIYLILFPQLIIAQNYIAFFDADAPIIEENNSVSIKSTTIPFTIIEGMMLVEATTNKQTGNYIIDTGAPSLVINAQPKSAEATKGRGISQSLFADEIQVKEFSWSNINKKDIPAFSVDISHLEAASGEAIAGIIGYDILKEVELLVDYQKQIVQMSPLESKIASSKKPLAVIPFTMQAHLPVIKVKIGKKKLNLALDTASESNILDQKLLKKLAGEFISDLYEGEMQGVDQEIKKVQVSKISVTNVDELSFKDMDYLFTNLSHLKKESNLYIDGLLGYPFLKQAKVSINYKEQKIYVWALY